MAAEFIYEVAVIVEDGAIADYVRGAARGVELCGDLGVENPELGFQSCGGVYREVGLSGDFCDQLYVVARFFEERAGFIGESGFAYAVSADEG